VLIGREQVCLQQSSEGCCRQSIKHHRNSNSKCPTTAVTMSQRWHLPPFVSIKPIHS